MSTSIGVSNTNTSYPICLQASPACKDPIEERIEALLIRESSRTEDKYPDEYNMSIPKLTNFLDTINNDSLNQNNRDRELNYKNTIFIVGSALLGVSMAYCLANSNYVMDPYHTAKNLCSKYDLYNKFPEQYPHYLTHETPCKKDEAISYIFNSCICLNIILYLSAVIYQ